MNNNNQYNQQSLLQSFEISSLQPQLHLFHPIRHPDQSFSHQLLPPQLLPKINPLTSSALMKKRNSSSSSSSNSPPKHKPVEDKEPSDVKHKYQTEYLNPIGKQSKEEDFEVDKAVSTQAVVSEYGIERDRFLVLSQKTDGGFVRDVVEIDDDALTVLNIPYSIKLIKKVKISGQLLPAKQRIKVSYPKNQLIFTPIHIFSTSTGIPLPYLLFSKIVNQHLVQLQTSPVRCSFPPLPTIPPSLIANSLIHGLLLKKSQVLGKWDERFVVINRDGLYSYRKFGEKPSMEIKKGSIKEIWTRFEIVEGMLVVKIKECALSRKIEFGVPICQFSNDRCWLFFLVGLMGKSCEFK